MKRGLHDVRQKLSSIKYERILHIVLTNNKDCPKILHFKQKVKKIHYRRFYMRLMQYSIE